MESTTERPRRRRWPWVVGILGGLFLLGCLAVFGLMAAAGSRAGFSAASTGTWEETYVSGSGADKVAVLPVEGVIGQPAGPLSSGGVSPEKLRGQLKQAADDESVRAVVLEIDSPGGGVVESDEMYRDILDFKQRTRKPVVVSMRGTAASGGYYISMAADKIVARPMTITGSLGVILSYVNYQEAANKLGLREVVIKSGKFKDIGSPARELTPEERQILQTIIDEAYGEFVAVIVKGRNLPEQRVRELADGRIYSGKQALANRLVDSLGDLQKAVSEAKTLARVQDATVVRYEKTPSLFELFQTQAGAKEPQAVQLLKAAGLDAAPDLQYLYRP